MKRLLIAAALTAFIGSASAQGWYPDVYEGVDTPGGYGDPSDNVKRDRFGEKDRGDTGAGWVTPSRNMKYFGNGNTTKPPARINNGPRFDHCPGCTIQK